MTVLTTDILSNDIYDYSIVWYSGEGSQDIAIVKKVVTPFKRRNPKYKYSRNNPQSEDRYITGKEDKLVFIRGNFKDLSTTPTSIFTTRCPVLPQTRTCVLIHDIFILNSSYVEHLLRAAEKIKK